LEFFFHHNEKIQLYYEGLIKAKLEWSDNIYKQFRFYSLQQMVSFVMSKNLSGDFAECGCWKGQTAYIISKILQKDSFSNSFHIFDSFEEGLSDKTEKELLKNMIITKIFSLPKMIVKKFYSFFRQILFMQMPLDEFDDYDHYWKKRGELPILFRYKYIASQLPENGIVLDIGCGDGTFLKYLKSQKPELELIGIDISDIAIARLNELGITGIVCDLTKDDLPSGINADYVVIMEVIEHLYNPESLMKKIKNIGAKRYYITIPNLGFIIHRLRLAIGGKMPITTIIFHIREHIRFWTVADFKYWSNCMGYKVVDYCGQNGLSFLWRIWPGLFSSQMIYILERKDLE
jgi:methionine biosynthesis protein MetW